MTGAESGVYEDCECLVFSFQLPFVYHWYDTYIININIKICNCSAPYVPPTPASWHYQLALLVTFLHAPFLFLLHQSGILYLHMFTLSTISVHLNVILNHIFSSQLSLPSRSVPAPLIRSSRFWSSINLVVCMYVCKHSCMFVGGDTGGDEEGD